MGLRRPEEEAVGLEPPRLLEPPPRDAAPKDGEARPSESLAREDWISASRSPLGVVPSPPGWAQQYLQTTVCGRTFSRRSRSLACSAVTKALCLVSHRRTGPTSTTRSTAEASPARASSEESRSRSISARSSRSLMEPIVSGQCSPRGFCSINRLT